MKVSLTKLALIVAFSFICYIMHLGMELIEAEYCGSSDPTLFYWAFNFILMLMIIAFALDVMRIKVDPETMTKIK